MEILETFRSIKIDELSPPTFLTPTDLSSFQNAKDKLSEIKRLLNKGATILELTPIPDKLGSSTLSVIKEFVDHYTQLSANVSNKTTQDAANYYRSQFEQIKNYHNAFFDISPGNNRITALNTINTFGNELAQGLDAKVTGLVNDLDKEILRGKELTKELSEKATQYVISDYALIFATQEGKNRIQSRNWLLTAISLSIIFVSALILSIFNDWLKVTITLTSIKDSIVSTNEIFNYPLLVSKFLIISFIIYIITFCFKQYSINKHLQTINQQRKNAINSYKLFEASLDKNDGAKKILMLELAKAIYELSQTGFIAKGNENTNGQFVEWTKIMDSKD